MSGDCHPQVQMRQRKQCQVKDCRKRVGTRVRRGCQVKGCGKAAQSFGRCKAHGGVSRCQVDGCNKGARSGGRCSAHGGGPRWRVEEYDNRVKRGEKNCIVIGGRKIAGRKRKRSSYAVSQLDC